MRVAYDVAVIGAGPAGASTAYHLARQGHAVLLMDKDRFPREKVCGDGLTPRCVDVLRGMGVRDCLAGKQPVRGVRLFDLRDGSGRTSSFHAEAGQSRSGLVVRRFELDNELCARAVEAGASFWPETTVHEIRMDGDRGRGVLATRTGQRIEVDAQITVVAEGSKGHFGEHFRGPDRSRSDIGFAVRQYAAGVVPDQFFDVYVPILFDDHPLSGYGWVFPAGEVVNIGAGFFYGDIHPGKINVRRLYGAFLAQLQETFPAFASLRPTSPLIGAPLRVALDPEHCVANHALLVGDASGVINPFNGEGISYALESGMLAATAISDTLHGRGHLTAFATALTKTFPRHVSMRSELPRLFSLMERSAFTRGRPGSSSSTTRVARGGAMIRAIRHLVSDHKPAATGLAVRDGLAAADCSLDAIHDEAVHEINKIDPVVGEITRYLFRAPSSLLGLPAALALHVARAAGRPALPTVRRLAIGLELFAASEVLLSDVKPADEESGHSHYNGLALLWSDVLIARALHRLAKSPVEAVRVVLQGAVRTLEQGLIHRADLAPNALGTLDCSPLVVSGAEAAAMLVGLDREATQLVVRWATLLAQGHQLIGSLVLVGVGDEVRHREATGGYVTHDDFDAIEELAVCADRLIAQRRGALAAAPLTAMVTALRVRAALARQRIAPADAIAAIA